MRASFWGQIRQLGEERALPRAGTRAPKARQPCTQGAGNRGFVVIRWMHEIRDMKRETQSSGRALHQGELHDVCSFVKTAWATTR
jgi:hypothetical protein